jgi:hypothetical protein
LQSIDQNQIDFHIYTKRSTKSIKVKSAFAIKLTYSVNAHTLSQSIKRREERKTSKSATRRDRKFSKNSTFIIQ